MQTKHILASLLSCFIIITASSAQAVSPSKEKAILQLMEITDSWNLSRQIVSQMQPVIWEIVKKNNKNLTENMISLIKKEMNIAMEEALPDWQYKVVSVYDRYFTESEINILIDFYSTEVGRKTIRIMPHLMTELTVSGQQWASEVWVPLTIKRMRDRLKK